MPCHTRPVFTFSPTSLADARRSAGLSQPALAAAAGVPVSTLRAIEQGRIGDPKGEMILRLAHALDVDPSSFYERDGAAA